MTRIERPDGITESERYLRRLGDRSFLSLWCYSGVYRDQGGGGGKGHGKELCDLLVVFGDHVIIFSDKDCAFPATGDLDADWRRWYKRAIAGAAAQIFGAERWIKSHPDRLFIDRACIQPLPVDLPPPEKAHFHRILVAHGAAERCKAELGGSGSLMLVPTIKGEDHKTRLRDGGMPFAVGHIVPEKGFVHVFDDTSLALVMESVDTITDFVTYLSRKERIILGGRLGGAAGEEDLLAYYLTTVDDQGEHDFVVPEDGDLLYLPEGH